VEDAQAGDKPRRGVAFVAEPARQLVLGEDGSFEYAPAPSGTCRADPFLASAAAIHGERMLAVVLTGRLDDAMRGIVAVKAAGGHVLAQDRETCAAFEMPGAAIATGCVDFVLPPRAIAAAIVTLSMMPAAHELFRVSRPPWALPAA
jgi:two-component system chemotaxis response regulator CheB